VTSHFSCSDVSEEQKIPYLKVLSHLEGHFKLISKEGQFFKLLHTISFYFNYLTDLNKFSETFSWLSQKKKKTDGFYRPRKKVND
jgi:hypothetical protein